VSLEQPTLVVVAVELMVLIKIVEQVVQVLLL
jgi:hypothetical protein